MLQKINYYVHLLKINSCFYISKNPPEIYKIVICVFSGKIAFIFSYSHLVKYIGNKKDKHGILNKNPINCYIWMINVLSK